MKLILGSQSPRRVEILSYFSLAFEQASPDFDEDAHPFEGDPERYVNELALGKALSLQSRYPDAAILTADTIVYREGKIYGKPRDADHAFEILMELQGSWHSVFTGVSLLLSDQQYVKAEESRVLFNALNEKQAKAYHEQLHCDDKAGGYAVQESGSLIVKKIDGCFYNVMGLPINTVDELLTKIDMSLWDHLGAYSGV